MPDIDTERYLFVITKAAEVRARFEQNMSDLWSTRSYLQRILEEDRQFMARAKSFLASAAILPPIHAMNVYLRCDSEQEPCK